MVAQEPPTRAGMVSWNNPDELPPAERHVLDTAKREHQETTEAARRAAKVAEQTADVGRNTLVELHRQGEQLDHIDVGLDELEEDVDEAGDIIKFMRRFCCLQLFTCCAFCDPHHKRDKTRTERLAKRKERVAMERADRARTHIAAAANVDRLMKKRDPAYGEDAEAARRELMATAEAIKAERATRDAGLGTNWDKLPEADRVELVDQAKQQDTYLDVIDNSLENMKALGMEINSELKRQDVQLNELPDKTDIISSDLRTLTKQAAKL